MENLILQLGQRMFPISESGSPYVLMFQTYVFAARGQGLQAN